MGDAASTAFSAQETRSRFFRRLLARCAIISGLGDDVQAGAPLGHAAQHTRRQLPRRAHDMRAH